MFQPLENPENDPVRADAFKNAMSKYNTLLVSYIDSHPESIKKSFILNSIKNKPHVIGCLNYLKWMVRHNEIVNTPASKRLSFDKLITDCLDNNNKLTYWSTLIYNLVLFAETHSKIRPPLPPGVSMPTNPINDSIEELEAQLRRMPNTRSVRGRRKRSRRRRRSFKRF